MRPIEQEVQESRFGAKTIHFFEAVERGIGRAITAEELTQALEMLCEQATAEQVADVIEKMGGEAQR